MDIALEGFWIPEFRTIKDEFVAMPTPSDPRRVNVLLGRNGSGKSSLLEALRLLGDHQAEGEWDPRAVAAYRVGAHFTGLETWRGPPWLQLEGLLHSLPDDDKFSVSVEDYTTGDPLRAYEMYEEDETGEWVPNEFLLKVVEDPAPRLRERFFELLAKPLRDRSNDATGKGQEAGPFTLEQWLVAIAAVDPLFLERDLEHDKTRLRVAADLADFEKPRGPSARWRINSPHAWTAAYRHRRDQFTLRSGDVQSSFLGCVNRWVHQAGAVLGPEIAATLIGDFLTRPLVLVGNAGIEEGSPGFPAFFGLGLLRADLDSEVANALEALAGETDQQENRLVDGLVSAWKDNSPIIRITHPELSQGSPMDLAEISHPLRWEVTHEWGGDFVDAERMSQHEMHQWNVDLAPATLMPDVIAATPQPGELLEYLENQLPALHDHVYFRDQKFIPVENVVSRSPSARGWGDLLREAGYFDPMRPADIRYPGPAVANGWCISIVPPSGPDVEGGPTGLDGGSPPRVRGSVKSIATMISQRANQLAPGFLGQEGWIAVQVTSPSDWLEGEPRLGVRLVRSVGADDRAEHATRLEHLSDGLARWVSLVVRLAVTDLKARSWMIDYEDRKAEVDAAVDASNLIGDGGQITAKEFSPDLGEVREVVPGYELVHNRPGEDWFKFAAMQEPRRLVEFADEHAQWKNTLILIDEPEVHLHLNAQRSVRDWIGDIAAGNYRAVAPLWTEDRSDAIRSAIVASHSTIFLDYPPETTHTTLVYAETAVEPREPTSLEGFDGATDPEYDNIPVTDGIQQIRTALTPVPEGQDLFQFFKGEQGERLGTSGIDVIALYSGFIVVEGPHDEGILEHFYGTELRERRIGVLRAWGTKNIGDFKDHGRGRGDRSFSLYENDLLTYIGKPVAILVDRAELGDGEKAAVNAFVRSCVNRKLPHWPDRGQSGGHPYPDIIAALPDGAVRAAFPNSTFDGWDPIVDEFEQMREQGTQTGNFKDFSTRRMGLEIQGDNFFPTFVQPILKECGDEIRPREKLEVVMNEIIYFMANPSADIGSAAIDDEPF